MSLQDFLSSPWKISFPLYEESAFNIRPAPEFSTAEVMVASLYRAAGFAEFSEAKVPKLGREFDKQSQASKNKKNETGQIKHDTWRTILHGVLESPKQPNQSSKRFLQLTPLVPDIALYSGSARLVGNPWNPGALVQRMIAMGTGSIGEANKIWDNLYDALSISESDDVWARWLQSEFDRRKKMDMPWHKSKLPNYPGMPEPEKNILNYPAKQFVSDLYAVMSAKNRMTRRQWISLLEAILRLASTTHVLWLCSVNDRLWMVMKAILGQGDVKVPETASEVREKCLDGEARYLSYGNPAIPIIKDYASRYLVARAGINLTLWALQENGVSLKGLQSPEQFLALFNELKKHKDALVSQDFFSRFDGIVEQEIRAINCKKGIGSNLVEFCRHTLGQRETTDETLRGYDQSYFLHRRGKSRNSPWVLSLGPVAILAVVHCCLHVVSGPRSVRRLQDYLGCYGIEVDIDDISSSELGKKMRMLGVVLDSPDAESGMLLTPPFGLAQQKNKVVA